MTKNKYIFPVLFLLLVCFFGFSGLAFFRFNNYMYLDILFIPVIFASMAGGYFSATLRGIIWGLIVLFSGDRNLPSHLPVLYILVPTIATSLFSVFSYRMFKKYNKFSLNNMYFILITTILFKSIITIISGNLSGFYSYYHVNNHTITFFLLFGLKILIEIIFIIIITKLSIWKFRQCIDDIKCKKNKVEVKK